jgi:hypothetical protein
MRKQVNWMLEDCLRSFTDEGIANAFPAALKSHPKGAFFP